MRCWGSCEAASGWLEMLKLRRGVVSGTDPLVVQVGGERRPAWADLGSVGEVREGDEVVVNVEARDLGLGSGGFDVVHVNLTRGLEAPGGARRHVMKLNYTSLQHPVEPVEARPEEPRRPVPVLVLALHGQLAPGSLGAGPGASGVRVGYVQTAGGALPGGLSTRCRRRCSTVGCSAGHVTAGPAYGGEREAVTVRRRSTPRRAARLGCGDRRAWAGHPRLRLRRSATAAWRRSTPRTRRSHWAARHWSRRASRAAIRVSATAASAITPKPCCDLVLRGREWPCLPAWRCPRAGSSAGTRTATTRPRAGGSRSTRTRRAACPHMGRRSTRTRFFLAALAGGAALAETIEEET